MLPTCFPCARAHSEVGLELLHAVDGAHGLATQVQGLMSALSNLQIFETHSSRPTRYLHRNNKQPRSFRGTGELACWPSGSLGLRLEPPSTELASHQRSVEGGRSCKGRDSVRHCRFVGEPSRLRRGRRRSSSRRDR